MKVGVIGGGQLAQMMALAGYPLGIQLICLEPKPHCPAALVTEVIQGEYQDQQQLQRLAQQVDVITYEFENIALSALDKLSSSLPVYPPVAALEIAQDRLHEKKFFNRLSIPTTHYREVNSSAELELAVAEIGLPAIVKTRRFGYDGKGQCVLREKNDLEQAWQKLGNQPLLVENLIKFDQEVSLIAVRNIAGDIAFYPLTINRHRDGILALSLAPYENAEITSLAKKYVGDMLRELNYVGVLAVEFFQCQGQLFANEIAPRVHNSGHWTIEGAQISQFENHLRAITGLPLGSTAAIGNSAMINLVGEIPNLADLLAIPEIHCHLYGKTSQPKRKLGHVTLCLSNEQMFKEKLQRMMQLIFGQQYEYAL